MATASDVRPRLMLVGRSGRGLSSRARPPPRWAGVRPVVNAEQFAVLRIMVTVDILD